MINSKRIILVAGTGRCGTFTLHRLLRKIIGNYSTHEKKPRLPWIFDENKFEEWLIGKGYEIICE